MTIYIGAVAPEAVEIIVTRDDVEIDMTTVTAATLEVGRPNGSTASWPCTLSDATTEQVTLTHAYASPDLPIAGTYTLVPKLAVPGGFVRAHVVAIPVKDPHRRT